MDQSVKATVSQKAPLPLGCNELKDCPPMSLSEIQSQASVVPVLVKSHRISSCLKLYPLGVDACLTCDTNFLAACLTACNMLVIFGKDRLNENNN